MNHTQSILTRARDKAFDFYQILRREVMHGNPALDAAALERVRAHYPVMIDAARNPPALAATIYAERRKYPVAATLETQNASVFDAGCGYGSESFLFASLGARVLAVDNDAEKICIARVRQKFFEEKFQRAFDITFGVADLDTYLPEIKNLSLTWLASVLAALLHQENFLRRVHDTTRDGGQVMVSDMNLWNPLFLIGEYRRRQRAARVNAAFAREQNFRAMFERRARVSARYFSENDATFDDVQFFHPHALRRLYESVGWRSPKFYFSGYIPPLVARMGLSSLETLLPRVPVLSQLGYFYLGVGVK